MQIHQLSIKTKHRKRVGRGGKRGNRSGRGGKGQTARAGSSTRPALRDFIKQIHKLKGVPARRYKKQGVKKYQKFYEAVNVKNLEKKYKDGDVVSPISLVEKKLVRKVGKKIPNVKILGEGELTKKLKFEGVLISENVKSKINK